MLRKQEVMGEMKFPKITFPRVATGLLAAAMINMA